MSRELLRHLPKVDELLQNKKLEPFLQKMNQEYLVKIIREEIDNLRSQILDGQYHQDRIEEDRLVQAIGQRLQSEFDFGLKKVINATGVVLHTNLGRAPMPRAVQQSMENILYGYCNLEYEIDKGVRGSRHDHLKALIQKLTGAEDVLVVNNNAAAVMLVLSTMAKGKEVIVSRGELVEIGGSFRIPKVMEHSGAILKEVGSTNKTHMQDYEEAIGENTAALMKVHTSNFKIMGFTDNVSIKELRTLADRYDLPIIDDLGSGVFLDLRKYGLQYEPTVMDSLNAGADIVTFSGDKLMGSAQCGVIVGKTKYIEKMKKNNLLRALRVDKLTITALTETLRMYLDSSTIEKNIPVLQMLSQSEENLREKANRVYTEILKHNPQYQNSVEITPCQSMVGGGSLPTQLMNSYGIKIKSSLPTNEFEKAMRTTEPYIVGRIEDDVYYLDMRTVFEEELDILAQKISRLLENISKEQ